MGHIDDAKEMIKAGIGLADIVKISSEELEFITDTDSLESGSEIIEKEFGNHIHPSCHSNIKLMS